MSIRSESSAPIEETTISPLFNLTNIRELDLSNIIVNTNQITGFSRLINIRDIDFSNVVGNYLENNAGQINFEELQTMKDLTRINFLNQHLVEEDFKKMGKLTSLISMDIMEYDNQSFLEYLSSLTNLTRIWYFGDGGSTDVEGLQYKDLTKLEYLVIPCSETVTQLQYLSRLTNLSVTSGTMTTEQLSSIALMTQLRDLDISCETEQGPVDLSSLINVSSITVFVPYHLAKDLDYQLRKRAN